MNEPRRLRDGACGDDLRALVRAAEDDVLDDEAVARLRSRLAAVGVAASGTTLAIGKGSALRALAAKVLAVVGAGAIAAFALSHSQTRQSLAAPRPTVTAVVGITVPAPVPTESSSAGTISVTDLPRSPPLPSVHVAARVMRATPPPAATTPREGLLLLQARRALPTDPARALSLVRQHETEFPDSQLAPEREKIRHEAAR